MNPCPTILWLGLCCRNSTNGSSVEDILLDEIPAIAIKFTVNSTAILLFGYIHMTCWVYTADRQIRVIRRKAFHNVLRQHVGFFDKNKSGGLVTSLTE